MNKNKAIALKRIANDMKELEACPLEGIGIASIANEPMKFVINMELMTGIYEGYKVQLEMVMPDEYPIKPPKIKIYPNQALDHRYHHHICCGREDYKELCINLLQNEFHMDTNEQYTGWNPAYTISSILLQVQNFLSDPDMPELWLPKKKEIEKLMKSMDAYSSLFSKEEGDKVERVKHTWKHPYPKMYYKKDKMEVDQKMDIEENEINEEKADRKMQMKKENLTCYMLRENYIDNPDILLGYPIIKTMTYGKNKIEIYPIPQLLSYEAYTIQTSQESQVSIIGSYYENSTQIKAANNQYYNNWLPIYVDENHFSKNKEKIINSLKAIKNESEFKPEQIFDILPIILNKMIIGMFSGKSIISSSFLSCYFHYVLLFKKLCNEYKEEYETYVNKKISLITMNDYEINKKIVPDIGDFLMLTYLSNKDMTTPEMKKMKNVLVEEFLIRQMYWIFHGPECKEEMKQKITKSSSIKVSDETYLELFHSDPYLKMRHLDVFNKEIQRLNIYDKLINIIANDEDFLWNYHNNWKYAKRMAEERIKMSFKSLYNEISQLSRDKIKKVIKEEMHFEQFFEEDEKQMKEKAYESFKVNEILKNNKDSKDMNDIIAYAYESQRGNQLLLITFFVLEKLGGKGFIEELEKNYGIYMGVDEFMIELKQKLKETKSYKDLYRSIGIDYYQEKTELEIIVEGYEKALKKRYIRDPNEKPNMSNNTSYVVEYRNNGYKKGNGYGYKNGGYNKGYGGYGNNSRGYRNGYRSGYNHHW